MPQEPKLLSVADLPKVHVIMRSPIDGEVFVDGVKLPHVTAVKFTAAVDEVPKLEVTMNAGTVTIDAAAEVVKVEGDEP